MTRGDAEPRAMRPATSRLVDDRLRWRPLEGLAATVTKTTRLRRITWPAC